MKEIKPIKDNHHHLEMNIGYIYPAIYIKQRQNKYYIHVSWVYIIYIYNVSNVSMTNE